MISKYLSKGATPMGIAFSLILFFISFALNAQNSREEFEKWKNRQQQEFKNFSDKQEKDYKDFRDKANAEYAEFMRKSWEEFRPQNAIPPPNVPELKQPPVADPETKPTATPLPVVKITPLPATTPQPQPLVTIPSVSLPEPERPELPILPKIEIPEPPKSETSETQNPESPEPPKPETPEPPKPEIVKSFQFNFFNTNCYISLDNGHRFSLSDASEQSVANAWEKMSGNQFNAVINDCLDLRNRLKLCDWGYYLLLKEISESFFGKTSNEAVLLQMFILTQSGYKVRIARTGTRLALLVPFLETIYDYAFLTISGVKYYILNKDLIGTSFYICNHQFPKEQYFSWQISQPLLAEKLNLPKVFSSKSEQDIKVSIQTNQNLIDFYDSYPLSSEWSLYIRTGLSETVKQTLYPALKSSISGKSQVQAAQILLNFCQTSFDYKTCDEQFGYERPFFADENFFFPYNNCKHRATLYALLVRELINLEVVILSYPEHLATAVHFPEDVSGDYFTVDGKKFLVCDPTYIGARIGMTMPQCKNTSVEIIKI